jgi:hypothetical protein
MNEAEWLTPADPLRVLNFVPGGLNGGTGPGWLPGVPSERKLRLFARACCRQLNPGSCGMHQYYEGGVEPGAWNQSLLSRRALQTTPRRP